MIDCARASDLFQTISRVPDSMSKEERKLWIEYFGCILNFFGEVISCIQKGKFGRFPRPVQACSATDETLGNLANNAVGKGIKGSLQGISDRMKHLSEQGNQFLAVRTYVTVGSMPKQLLAIQEQTSVLGSAADTYLHQKAGTTSSIRKCRNNA